MLKFTDITLQTGTLQKQILFFFSTLLLIGQLPAQARKFHFSEQKMGSPFNLVLVSDDSAKAASLARECFALVDSLNRVFSDYDSNSELSRLNANAGKAASPVSSLLRKIIVQSNDAYRQSAHAFDITVGPLSRLWRKARKEKKFPDSLDIVQARDLVGFQHLRWNASDSSILLEKAGMQLDLGGIAKGSAAQEVIRFLQTRGIHQALLDAGGDMAMSQAPPGTGGWTIAINIPENTDELLPRRLLLQNKAVATSGDVYQYMEHKGKRYAHIIDPRTGYGIASQRNVTVIADDGALADWLATACSILSIPDAKKLAVKKGAELLITELRNNRIVYHATRGFSRYWKR